MGLVDTGRAVIKRRKLLGSMSDTFIGLGNLGGSGLAQQAEDLVAGVVAEEILRERYPELFKKKKKVSRRRGFGKVSHTKKAKEK